tara:strand:+ start:1584 stop:1781 length:198 start_codon:yes stop_codon:yes gene_type:complete
MDRNLTDKHKSRNSIIGIGFIIGLTIGIVVGSVTDNMGFWIAMGTGFGLVFGAGLPVLQKNKADD